jgi:hypothetical protein
VGTVSVHAHPLKKSMVERGNKTTDSQRAKKRSSVTRAAGSSVWPPTERNWVVHHYIPFATMSLSSTHSDMAQLHAGDRPPQSTDTLSGTYKSPPESTEAYNPTSPCSFTSRASFAWLVVKGKQRSLPFHSTPRQTDQVPTSGPPRVGNSKRSTGQKKSHQPITPSQTCRQTNPAFQQSPITVPDPPLWGVSRVFGVFRRCTRCRHQ